VTADVIRNTFVDQPALGGLCLRHITTV